MALLDLKVNKKLLDIKFEGYKLSLDPIPILKRQLDDEIEYIAPSNKDYGYFQTRMSVLLNHLYQDPWDHNSVFYITEKYCVFWASLKQDGRLTNPRIVWHLQVDNIKYSNSTISFPGIEWALLSNGEDVLYIFYTPSRTAGEPWILCHTFKLAKYSFPYYILHAVHRNSPNGQHIDCILASTENKSYLKINASNKSNFIVILEWLSLSCGQNIQIWYKKKVRKLVGYSFPEYTAIDHIGDAICIISQSGYNFFFDSERPIEKFVENSPAKEATLYTYIQTPEEITVMFHIPDNFTKDDIKVNFLPSFIELLIQGNCVLKGQLANCIDISNSTWIIEKQKLQIILSKAEIGLMWQELIKNDNHGEEIMDPDLVEKIHSRLVHLTSDKEITSSENVPFNLDQYEECDTFNEPLLFQRIDGNSHEETHRVNMGGHQFLFNQQIFPESLPAICLRHDVDAILWQPKNVSSEGETENFKIEHVATFSALGYVQASKQDKKFIFCSPDFQYSIISDCSRHIYVYCQPENLHSALKLHNRKTGESILHIAKQYVINFEQCDQILGVQTSSRCIFVLGKKMLYVAKIDK